TPALSCPRSCSPANQSSGPLSVIRTESFPASLLAAPLWRTDSQPQETALMRSAFKVVKEIAVASRDVSVEDSLYETVKEIKDTSVQPRLTNGTIQPSPSEPPPQSLVNGHPSPCTPERGPLCEGVEYASVDLRKKSRHSADIEAKRCPDNAAIPSHKPPEEPEEDRPPPVPRKVLDENDNQSMVMNGVVAGLHNGEVRNVLHT
ncbi:hypothetical protein GOODEAATRI_006532, partial [Goodea atripinnis]